MIYLLVFLRLALLSLPECLCLLALVLVLVFGFVGLVAVAACDVHQWCVYVYKFVRKGGGSDAAVRVCVRLW